jgi:hypothetical protein
VASPEGWRTKSQAGRLDRSVISEDDGVTILTALIRIDATHTVGEGGEGPILTVLT